MVLDNKDTIIYLAQERLAEWGGYIVSKGIKSSNHYQNKARTLRYFLHAIQYSEFLEDIEVINILQAINRLANLTDWPTAPVLTEQTQPTILVGVPGEDGSAGAPGNDGSDADINITADPNYDNMAVSETDVAGVKTFLLGYAPYTLPTVSVNITTSGFPNPNSLIQELGTTVVTVPMVTTLAKGRENVTAASIITPAALDVGFQAQLNLASINAGNPQVITENDSNIVADTTYTADIDDGTNNPSNSKVIEFIIPFLEGSSAALLVQATFYANLTKLIEKQGDKQVVFDGTDEYFYFMYDASYPALSKIYDGNNFDVTSAFIATTENADLASGTVSMRVYRTLLTDISNQIYSFNF